MYLDLGKMVVMWWYSMQTMCRIIRYGIGL